MLQGDPRETTHIRLPFEKGHFYFKGRKHARVHEHKYYCEPTQINCSRLSNGGA